MGEEGGGDLEETMNEEEAQLQLDKGRIAAVSSKWVQDRKNSCRVEVGGV